MSAVRLAGGDMSRRAFLCGTVAMFATPLATRAQQSPVSRIGILMGQSSSDLLPALNQFRGELRNLGWIEGQTIIVLEPR